MGGFEQLEDWAGALLAKLAPAERRKIARTIAIDLRRSQQQRIAAQRNPDGSAFTPRKRNLRAKAGRIKRRKLFPKIAQAKHLKATGNEAGAVVAFTGRTARIARVHQFGVRDRVSPGGPDARYPVRQLLGFTPDDRERVRDLLIQHLTR